MEKKEHTDLLCPCSGLKELASTGVHQMQLLSRAVPALNLKEIYTAPHCDLAGTPDTKGALVPALFQSDGSPDIAPIGYLLSSPWPFSWTHISFPVKDAGLDVHRTWPSSEWTAQTCH